MTVTIGRRELLAALGGAAASWPLAARAQQADRVRRIGMLMAWAETDPEVQPRMAAFMTTLRELGWVDGRSCRFEFRWSAGDLVGIVAEHAVSMMPHTKRQ